MNKNSRSMQTSPRICTPTSSKGVRSESEFTDTTNLGIRGNPVANNHNIDNLLDSQKISESNMKQDFLEKVPLKASDVLYHLFPELMNNACSDKIIHAGSTNKIVESLQNPGEHVRMFYACGGLYIGETKEGKRHGIGKMFFASYEIYEGEWKEDQMHGKGKYEWLTGSVYKGSFKDGKRDGKRDAKEEVYQHFDGTSYDGDFKDDKFHGFGIAKTNAGNYEGEWKEGLRDGQGKMTFQSHPKFLSYEGVWCKDKMAGKGKLDFKNGDTYKGDFEDDGIRDGQGKMTFQSHPKFLSFEGVWCKEKMAEKGKFYFKNGDTYEGAFEGDGIQNGTGDYIWSKNHMFYSGTWKNGRRDGEGRMECSKGGTYQGTWKDDRMEGNGMIQVNTGGSVEFTFGSFSDVKWQDPEKCEFSGKFTTPAGGYYKGDWLEFRKHGKDGESLDADGTTIKGEFVADSPYGEVIAQFPHLSEVYKLNVDPGFKSRDLFQLCSQLPNGKGKANGSKKYHSKLENGVTYYGEWDNERPHGKGRMIYSDQSMYKGQFEKGKRHGKGEQTEADRSKKYSGIWKNDMKDGEFIVEHSSGLFEQLIYKNDQDPKRISEEEEQKLDPTPDPSENSPSIYKKIASSIQNQPKNNSSRQQQTYIYPCGQLRGCICSFFSLC